MNPKHVSVFEGGFLMRVDDGPLRVIEGEIVAVNAAREVNILGVHEEPFVEESRFHRRGSAQEHETAAEIGRVDRPAQIQVPHFVPFVAFSDHPCRQKTTPEDIYRRRKTFGKVLLRTVGVDDFRHELSHFGVYDHPIVHFVYIFCFDLNIAVHHQMKVCPIVRALAQSYIMRFPVTQVRLHCHIPQFLRAKLFGKCLFLRRRLRFAEG